jgi:hypothetical protein
LVKYILILLLFIISVNSFAEIKVSADRNPIGLNESFKLIFKSTDSSVDSPDFSPLEQNFEILSQNQGTQIQIINGQQNSTKQWTLTLMPKLAGKLMIPEIEFGQEHSKPSVITVKEQNKTSENTQQSMFLEVEATPETPYVQSQVIYTIRLFYALNLQSGSMSEPSFSGGEVLVKKIGEDRQYQTIHDSKRFGVIERKYALFPQQSGSITIEPINFKAQVIENNGRGSGFDNFFYQPKTHIKRLLSKSIKLEVKPIPNNFQGKNWLPAKNLTLTDSFSKQLPEFKVGEPVTRTLTLSANGLTIGQLPELMNHTNQLKQYTDQPKLEEKMTYNGINSIRQEKIAIIPSKAGEYTLPAIEIPWWNTETDKMEILKLPAHTIKVAEATTIQQIQPVITQTPTPKLTQNISENTNNDYYKWLTFIFGFAWIVTLIAFFMKKTNKKPQAKPEKQENTTTALKKLKQACKDNNAQQAKQAILIWAKANSLAEISQHCAEPLKAEIQGLNTFLYGKTGEEWQGIKLWNMFNKHQPKKLKKKHSDEDGLEPLYLKT